ncbi:MAG: sodium:solute symporter family transporter [Thermoguttaceae bacterium]
MESLTTFDLVIFIGFLGAVIAIGIAVSRGQSDSESYFLAGRDLSWWLIGFSLIAANISAEQFVGMSGQAARASIGLAVASYEWIAAVTLVAVAFLFLPAFLRSGIYTIPEFLEYRYNHWARMLMSLLMVVIYVFVTIATVIFLGAKALEPLFTGTLLGVPMNITSLSWAVGIVAAAYVFTGGLKACAWADLLQGTALIAGGAVIMVLAFRALDRPADFEGIDPAAVQASLGVPADASLAEKFASIKAQSMHMVLPASSTFLPWTALLLGIWIPNLYYWGLNQYIMQRTLAANSLAEGQKGIVFAAGLKLVIPFIVCVPGIIAFTLYAPKMAENAMNDPRLNRPVLAEFRAAQAGPPGARIVFPFDADFAALHPKLAGEIHAFNAAVLASAGEAVDDLAAANSKLIATAPKEVAVKQKLIGYDYDGAFPLLVRYLTPPGWRGFVLAALMGAVISSLAAMLNAASTMFTMDLYQAYFNRNASQRMLVWVGRICVVLFVLIGCALAPRLADPRFSGAFAYIQEFQGYVSPGILAVFIFGLFVPRAPRMCGLIGLLLSPPVYGYLHLFHSRMAFLNRMAVTVGILIGLLAVLTLLFPLKEPVRLPVQTKIDMTSSPIAKTFAWVVVAATIVLYVVFW